MFRKNSTSFNYPRYIRIYNSGELAKRIEKARISLEKCQTCPWDCQVNRMNNEIGVCRIGRYAKVSSYFPHHGEEDCLRGWRGSGTIFFSGCNLRCVFCQNADISQTNTGNDVTPEQLANIMLELQEQDCHNINLVTPEHVVPQILESLYFAIQGGLNLPIVYNTSGFDSMESLQFMDGMVDIYMPDFKYWSEDRAKRYLISPLYPGTARAAIREMHRQVGDLVIDETGLARRGLLVRHLVMPEGLEETYEIMRFLAREISPQTWINIMDQYHPSNQVNRDKYPEINRRITYQELNLAYSYARNAGLNRFYKK